MKISTRIVIAIFVGFVVLAIAGGSVYVSESRPLSGLEASLLNIFLWIASVVLGWMINSIYSEHSHRDSLLERAKPAIRRVWELQRSAEQLQHMFVTRNANAPSG